MHRNVKEFLFSKFEKSGLSNTTNRNIYADSIISASALNKDFFDKVDALAPFEITGIWYLDATVAISTAGLLQSAPVNMRIFGNQLSKLSIQFSFLF